MQRLRSKNGMPGRLSARRRRSIDQLWIDRFQTVRPSQLIEVNLLLVHFLGLRPQAETAQAVVVDFVERDRTRAVVPLLARRFLAEIERGLGVGRDGGQVLLRDVAALHRRPQPADCRILALWTGKPFRPRARDQVPLDVAGRIGQVMCFVRANLERARADRLPNEKGGNLTAAQRRGQDLRVQILYGDLRWIDPVLGQIFGNKPRPRGADPRRDGFSNQILWLCDLFSFAADVAFCVPLDNRNDTVLYVAATEILDDPN